MSYNFSKLISYLDGLHNDKGLPSGDVAVYQNGKQVFRYIAGNIADDALYYMFSCTKPVTAAAAMQLVERGMLGLDDPVSKYLPEYGNAVYSDGDSLINVGEKLKIRHLFTMSGGLNYNCESAAINRIKAVNPDASTLDIVPAFVENTPLEFEPGTKFRYSLCLDVLAAVVELISGIRYSDWLQENIFDPLEMKDATMHLTSDKEYRLSPAFTVRDGKIVSAEKGIGSFAITENFESGGAGLVCTTEDYGKFAAAMSCGGISASGVRILKPETVDLLRSPQMTEKHGFCCAGGPGYAYGFGVRTLVTNEFGARSCVGEFGWDGAAGSYILMDPDVKVGISYTQQVLGWPGYFGCMHAPIRDFAYEGLGL